MPALDQQRVEIQRMTPRDVQIALGQIVGQRIGADPVVVAGGDPPAVVAAPADRFGGPMPGGRETSFV